MAHPYRRGAAIGGVLSKRGGGWNYDADSRQVGLWVYDHPYYEDLAVGFRFARSQ